MKRSTSRPAMRGLSTARLIGLPPASTSVVYDWLQHFTTEQLEKELMECGFVVDAFYSDVAGASFDPTSREFAVVAKKA